MSNAAWTVQDSKSRLSEVLRRARSGKPQRIGLQDDACIVISAAAWEAMHPTALGAWLVESAPSGEDLEAPSRRSKRADPFESEGPTAQ